MANGTDCIDASYARLESLLKEVADCGDAIFTESDARMKIIDTMFIDVLGWHKSQVSTSEQAGSGFLDYKLKIDEFAKVIIEAKRLRRSFDLGTRECGEAFKLSGPVFSNADLQEGIQQAIKYSSYKGTELACVTNGKEWVVFRSNRLGDGLETLEGKAFVFPSLDCIKSKFRLFYDLLGEPCVKKLTYRGLFQEAEGKIIRHTFFERKLRADDSAQLMPQPEIISSLDRLMTAFFQRLTDEKDKEMLEFCFVETKESRAAENRLLRLAGDIAGHIRALDPNSGKQLSEILSHAQMAHLNQFILLVGTKGAGKSTFIHRFFDLKLPSELRDVCVPIFVDLKDTEGDEKILHNWLRKKLLEKTENALHGEPPTWHEIIGQMFFSEYQRWSKGSLKHLYEKDKQEFQIQFGNHIEKIRADDPTEYIRGLLRNIVRSRRRLPCLVFDNADHFSIEFQERVFQFARSIYEQDLCVVIMPITDKTSWQLSRQGALQSFENEALLLPTPSPKQVVEKRIEFVRSKLRAGEPKEKDKYFFGKGILIEFNNLERFTVALQEIFLNSDKTASWIGSLTNHDVRSVLELSRDLINSPHLGFDEALKVYMVGSAFVIPEHKVRHALFKGRYDIFVPASRKYLHNVFNLNSEIQTSPLLGLRILQALKDAAVKHGDTKSSFISKADFMQYMLALQVEPIAVKLWLDVLLKKALVFNYDPTCMDEQSASKIEISPAGDIHLYWGKGNFDYLFSMAETTPIWDKSDFDELNAIYCNDLLSHHKHAGNLVARFIRYLISEDQIFCRVPDHESYTGQIDLLRKLEATARLGEATY